MKNAHQVVETLMKSKSLKMEVVIFILLKYFPFFQYMYENIRFKLIKQ